MSERQRERYRRLLLLIPYVLANPGVHLDELSQHFGAPRHQLVADLDLIFMCGLPGYGPGDLIEVDIQHDRVTIRAAEYLSQPQTITPAEGLMLYAAAIALQAAGGDADTTSRATSALEKALGGERMGGVSFQVGVPESLQTLRSAVEDRKKVNIVYLSQSKDEETVRDVDPWGLVLAGGRWYLVGYCNSAKDERIFLVDRIKQLKVLSVDAEVPEGFDASRYSQVYTAGEEAFQLVMELSPRARWVTEYYQVSSEEPLDDGWTRVTMDASGQAHFVKLLLKLGPHVRLVEPAGLKEKVAETACRLLKKYR